MKVTAVSARAWDLPMRAPYRSARRVTVTAHNVLATVTLDREHRGYGEAAPAFYVTGETAQSVLTEIHRVIPQLSGADAEDAARYIAQMEVSPGACAALEVALSDARSQAENIPLWRFLGGDPHTETIRITDCSLPILPADEAAARAVSARRFRALKIKVGSGDFNADVARVRAIAQAAPNTTLRLDGNQGFTANEAVRFVETLSDLASRLELFEQPTAAAEDAALKFVADRVSLPIFADEAVHTPDDARRLLESGACRGVVLKLAKSGLSGAREIAQTAHRAGGVCLMGCLMESRIMIAAALHLAIALGTAVVPLLDLDGHRLVNDDDWVHGGFTVDADHLCPLALPGLGVRVHSPAENLPC